MKSRFSFLIGTLTGLIAAAVIVNASATARFQWSAWNHHAAIWTYNPNDWQPRFEWLDDYNTRTKAPAATQPQPHKHSPFPTPIQVIPQT